MRIMAWLALAVYLIGMALAFGWRSYVQWRSTGSTGFRGASGPVGSAGWWGGFLFAAAVVAGLAAPVLTLAGLTTPWPFPTAAGYAGLVLALSGVGLVLAAQRQMGASWRIGVDQQERTHLVTSGLFAHVRNPIFTGMAAVMMGLALMVPSVLAMLAALALITAVQIQVRVVEEPYLMRVHGGSYSEYAARAGRFLPRLGRRVAADR